MFEHTMQQPMSEVARPLEFEVFFRDEYPRLARACYLLTGDGAEAEDLAQEAMVRAFERWERVSDMESPDGYLYQTAFNLNHKRSRRLALRARRVMSPSRSPDPASIVESKNEVMLALGAVPIAQREALVLVGWLGMDASEAGRVLGIDAVSVRGRVHRARSTLREKFGDDEA